MFRGDVVKLVGNENPCRGKQGIYIRYNKENRTHDILINRERGERYFHHDEFEIEPDLFRSYHDAKDEAHRRTLASDVMGTINQYYDVQWQPTERNWKVIKSYTPR